jgi:O-glycosyl hydrolase
LKGFQDTYGVKFYAISIQNELDFEEFYNSMLYPTTASYLTALKAVRAEFDAQPDLKDIRILGPEDVIGGDAYGMYRYGSSGTPSERDKNLNFLNAIAADPAATAAIGGFNIHGYAADGVTAAGADSQLWDWWVNGWTQSPGGGLPSTVVGFSSFGKPSWMTETSGEATSWLAYDSNNFPSQGAFAIAIGMHESLVAGQESAFLYWQLTDSTAAGDAQSLTGTTALATAPKYNAMKHFARYIRPGSVRVSADVSGTGSAQLLASAYVRDADQSLTIVLINENPTAVTASLSFPATPAGIGSYQTFTSSDGSYWVNSTLAVSAGSASLAVPGYGVVTLHGVAASSMGTTGGSAGGSSASSGGTAGSGGSSSGNSSGGSTGSGAASSSTSAGSPGATSAKGSGCSSGALSPSSGWGEATLALAFILSTRRRRRAP